ncbi:NAD(P)-binding protein [Lepidopterella palustris CBS 459.81]|uniref:NAD(P)-binding protein n=1 Tax=Lepidopterella palustris CBS 459.81 TaxID=1314670 RepID=A0A8E2E8D9_9PEZI|nr:NAD(P)-binding protein [Lepidopterella palustris CBS 459.81]
MTSNLEGKVYTVTGGASGMGKATAKLLAQRGAAAVCIGDFNDKNFDTVKEEIAAVAPKTEIVTTKLDVSNSGDVKSWIQSVIEKFGRLDGSANVAGVPQASNARQRPTILEENDEGWKRTMSVNIDGVMYCTREEVRAMVSLPKEPTGRAIVNVASLASMMHTPDTYAYGASKRACASFSSSVAKDVLGFGIRVNTVSPGATLTPMMSQFFPDGTSEEAIKALGMYMVEPIDIARAIVYLLSEESDKITGVNLAVGSGTSLA